MTQSFELNIITHGCINEKQFTLNLPAENVQTRKMEIRSRFIGP